VCFTLFTNVIPMVAMIYFMAVNWSNSCAKPLQIFLLVQVALFFINGCFGYYVYQKVEPLSYSTKCTFSSWYSPCVCRSVEIRMEMKTLKPSESGMPTNPSNRTN
jgi:hypothetical protein